MDSNLNQNMLSQGSDFNLLNYKIENNHSPLSTNISNNFNNNESFIKEYNETENNFNKLLSKYSDLQNKIMSDILKGNNNQNDIELLDQINSQLVSLSNELNNKLEKLNQTDNDLLNRINSQQNILKDYHNQIISSNKEYLSHSPSFNSLQGEVESSHDYYRYNYSWYIVWLILSIIIFYLVFSISANGLSNSNGLLIVVIALLSLYFIKKFIDYIRWSWNFKLPSWRPHINIQSPKVVFKQYIPQ